MRTPVTTALALGIGGLVLLGPVAARAQSACQQDVARNLLATNYLDVLLNPPTGEDSEFYTVTGGVPNIFFIIDTSGSMERMPPDGPTTLGDTVPSGYSLGYETWSRWTGYQGWNDAGQQWNALNGNQVVGCILDTASNTSYGMTSLASNDMMQTIAARQYYSSCGLAVDQTSIGAAYRGHSTETGGLDYAVQASVCPHYTSSDTNKTGDPGFDPDYYPTGTATGTEVKVGSVTAYFGRDLVFHDTNYSGKEYVFDTGLWYKHNFGKGWTDEAVYPARSASNTYATIDTFCAQQGTKAQGSSTRAEICKTCLKKAGWYYDGVRLTQSDGKEYPSLWYTGNYLNFYPPKFIVAKKIVKDVIRTQSKVRMALGHFNYPDNLADIKDGGLAIDQGFNPTCDHPESNFDSNRGSYVNSVNALSFVGGTPLANAVFDVGQYYHSPDLPWFSGGKTSMASPSNPMQYSLCYQCQASSVVLITDGMPSPNADIGDDGSKLPSKATTKDDANGKYAGDTNTGILGITKETCPQCDNFSGTKEYMDNLPKVAWYMHNMDLRKNSESTVDCQGNGGKQVLDLYTVGFATSKMADAEKLLSAAAKAGGGSFISADNTDKLRTGLYAILESINERATSFSVATVSTLQTTSGRSVIVPRFEPSSSSHFKGHLMSLDLYSEFVNTCDPLPDGTGTGDVDCDGKCQSVFLMDKDRDFVLEDSLGNFVKSSTKTPTCSQAPLCKNKAGKSCGDVSSTAAVSYWDAGALLAGTTSTQKWKARTVWTVVDDSGDGKIDAADTVIQLQPTDTVATALVPYLGLGGGKVCTSIAAALTSASNPTRAAAVLGSQVECAKTVIRYVLGADILNEQERDNTSYPASSEDDLWDRPWLLGDIFHSSPVVVDAPLPRLGVICPNGFSNQCLQSLWDTPTPNGKAAYDGYQKATDYVNRRKFVLVGGNDALVHAFDGGAWKAGENDPTTGGVDESLPPFNGYYDREGGSELWAFLPPDMIAKTPLLLTSPLHHFFVDGTPMVRDVWVDGTSNGLAEDPAAATDRKEAREYHTVAVLGERRGGTHFFALDVTNASEAGTKPGFLWIYPQPDDPKSLDFGETYGEFLPRPPPVGPVRIKADAASGAANGNTPVKDGTAYHERWVVFLNGGYDPQYVRGRGVYMVDVWTGKLLFDFAYSPDTTKIENALRFPVPAAVGMTGWGVNVQRLSGETNDYFFDTATFGDAGGQLWAIRFHEPGTLDATTKKVTNWYGARVFQMGTSGQSCKLCAGQPFFYMTANMPLPDNGAYRVFAGTGDRYNLLDIYGGTCGPDNLRACVLRGCKVEVVQASNVLASYGLGSAARGLSQTACGAITNTEADGTVAACEAYGKAKIVISACPSPNSGAASGTTKDMSASCTYTSSGSVGYGCSPVTQNGGAKLSLSDTNNGIVLGNMYYSLLVFESGADRPIFSSATTAATYDSKRIWLNETGVNSSYVFQGTKTDGLVTIAANDNAPAATSLADATSKGWVIYYNNGPTASADDHTYNVYWADERTSSNTGTLGDIYWNTIQPATGEVLAQQSGCKANKCGAIEARRVARKYGANVTTGGLAAGLHDTSGALVRSISSALLVPTQADQPTVFVNQSGQIAVGLTAVNPERGATNVGQTDGMDASQDYGTVEVNRELHACRHAGSAASAACK